MALIPFDDRDGSIWLDGEIVPWRDAKTHTLSHGLHYASLVFEGERVYSGVVFEGVRHTKRLRQSCNILDFDIPITDDEVEAAKLAVVEANNIVDGYVRAFCWRGSEMMAISAQQTTTHVAIAAWEWPSYFDPETKMKGITLDISQWRRPSPESAPVQAKAAGLYMICTLSKHAAEKKGFQDSLMLDYRGYIAEATGANVFFIDGEGTIHTPIPDCFLNGITRQTVIEMAKSMQIKVVERHMNPEDMASMKECFLTGTAAEVTPVSQIGDYKFTPSDISRQLVDGYENLVRGR
ncbi:branched-chain amino acid aminotransferase [Candidatus Puniceispirillum marinum]|jgi:branched-chain amino acid aminotransferase|uniref:Branched-chain-amino-acid aminotransferase n=1 Tax=Puniceispirillum marinum (strain IMCC1322) TaxID=488538 RepID=D5BP15_PUNMI|nr:branched-chain amino acid aminotransferase [Candidatus Puniceispirillum marinum]ADE40449.1 branched-chain amino acid aminotransferase [Candidatus Puniceispirillum marinum IMCC1322]